VLTEEDAIQRLNGIARWAAPATNEKVIFDLASSQELEGWTLKGNAFSVATAGELVPRPTLNSLALGGETATGTALSPAFVIEPRFDALEVVFQGGWNQGTDGEENLILRLLDADNGAVLERILPPGTHVLTTRHLKLDKLTGKTIRIQMVDNNTDSSFAWIGLRKVSLRAAQLPEAK
jgi:hypothetical protein